MRLLLKYPSRSRPDLFQKRIANWDRLRSGVHSRKWLCSFDVDDPTMNNVEMQRFCTALGLHAHYGRNRSKVAAINADMDQAGTDWDVLVLVSDDMATIEPDWDHTIAEQMQQNFPDLNGALWFPDGVRRDLCTLSIMGRPVYEQLGYIYHPAFQSVYCDDHFHQLMHRSGRLHFVDQATFKHEWRQENNDALMQRNENRATAAADKATYERLLRELPGG